MALDQAQRQRRLIEALRDPSVYAHAVDAVEVIETHISTVLLAGDFAYKIKKPVDLGFVDFTRLDDRRFYCEEELRLNSRLAPSLYLEVVGFTGKPDAPEFDGEGNEAFEYAVRMRRFDQDQLLDRVIATDDLPAAIMDNIADAVAAFHMRIPAADGASGYGTPDSVFAAMKENFEALRPRVKHPERAGQLQRLEDWTRRRFEELRPLLVIRLKHGSIRECHGDMHLGNMALIGDHVEIFDGIEFNAALRWIDVINEIAFLTMDLDHRDHPALGWRFLNRYLEHTGDFDGLTLLPFYQVYRALVRAKVAAIRSGQDDIDKRQENAAIEDCHRLLDIAEGYTRETRPALFITCGLSGSGKTTFSRDFAQRYGAIHLRSDVERKRLFGLEPGASSGSGLGADMYSATASRLTYEQLLDLARELLAEGHKVIVDATFLERAQRHDFAALARDSDTPFAVSHLDLPEPVLRERIRARAERGGDASEADTAVLDYQLGRIQPPAPPEPVVTVHESTLPPKASLEDWLAGNAPTETARTGPGGKPAS